VSTRSRAALSLRFCKLHGSMRDTRQSRLVSDDEAEERVTRRRFEASNLPGSSPLTLDRVNPDDEESCRPRCRPLVAHGASHPRYRAREFHPSSTPTRPALPECPSRSGLFLWISRTVSHENDDARACSGREMKIGSGSIGRTSAGWRAGGGGGGRDSAIGQGADLHL